MYTMSAAKLSAWIMARTIGKCKACEYYMQGEEMTRCGVGKGMGHCAIFDFVCSDENGCQAWEAKGSEEEMEMEDEE
jgi:hypothetical protein